MRFTTLAILAVGIAAPFAVANAQQAPQGYGPPQGYEQGPPPGYQGQAPQGYDQGQYGQQDRRAMRHLLSREERVMLKQDLRSQGGQVKQAFQERMQQLASMSPDQQAQMRNQLQSEWNALPAQQKQQLEQQIAERREQHQQRRQGGQYDQQQPGQQFSAGPQYGQQGPSPRYNNDGDDD